MTEEEPEEAPAYELVMPFIVCRSNDGPYEDEAFVAGYHLGQLDLRLAIGIDTTDLTIRTASIPQLDLIAMEHGYQMTEIENHDEWTTVRITPNTNP